MECTIHDVQEFQHNRGNVYPYRCSHCGKCFLCQHERVGYEHWICHNGKQVSGFNPGVDA